MKDFVKRIQYALNNNDKKTYRLSMYVVLSFVAIFMIIVNLFTNKFTLAVCLCGFVVLCVLDYVMTKLNEKLDRLAVVIFLLQVLAMFTYFVVSGDPEGFSAIWCTLIPLLSMFVCGRKCGSAVSAAMFLILTFLFWTPFGKSLLLYNYNDVFMMRFPMFYAAAYLSSIILATITENAFKQVLEIQDKYLQMTKRDALTGIWNRQGMYSELNRMLRLPEDIGVLMLDIDHFKSVNDTLGHAAGDTVLKSVAQMLEKNLYATVCRWGGEEFVAIYKGGCVTHEELEKLRITIAADATIKKACGRPVTVSMGVFEHKLEKAENIDTYINNADEAMYVAKNSGRNCIVYYNRIKAVD